MYGLVYSLRLVFQTIHFFFSLFYLLFFIFITLYSNKNIYIYIVIKKGCIVCIVCIVFLKSLGEISKNNLGNNNRHFKLYIYTSIHSSFYRQNPFIFIAKTPKQIYNSKVKIVFSHKYM
jgi:hypothetical protein